LAKFACKLAPNRLDFFNFRMWWTLPRPCQQNLEIVTIPFGEDLDGTLRTIAREPVESEGAGLIQGCPAEEYTLHSTCND
jgi:hypothetical protein